MTLRELGESKQLEQFLLSRLAKREVTDIVHKYAKPYKELMAYYRCAMMEVSAKFNVLNEELSLQYDRNPIETIKTRLKSPESIVEKLQRRGYPLTVESIEKNLNDVAGVRVICSYTSDIYMLADAFIRQDDITLLERKDYIEDPKPNGYRSLHLIVEIPQCLAVASAERFAEGAVKFSVTLSAVSSICLISCCLVSGRCSLPAERPVSLLKQPAVNLLSISMIPLSSQCNILAILLVRDKNTHQTSSAHGLMRHAARRAHNPLTPFLMSTGTVIKTIRPEANNSPFIYPLLPVRRLRTFATDSSGVPEEKSILRSPNLI